MPGRPTKPKKQTLTPKRKRLVEEMAKAPTESLSKLARKAGFSESSARVDVYRLVKTPAFTAALRKRQARALAHHEVTPEEVIGSAAFNMRTSIDDVLDKEGRFDVKKARRTGAIDVIKKIEIIEDVDIESGIKTIKTKVELESPAAARKELANYIGVERFGDNSGQILETFKRICNRIVEEAVLQKVSEREMAEFFLSDERVGRMDADLIRMIEDRFLRDD